MSNQDITRNAITVDGKDIKIINSCIYLKQQMLLSNDRQDLGIKRRIRLSLAANGKLNHVMKMKIPIELKTKVYN